MKVLQGKKLPNGFLWLPIHFTHDPAKRSLEWEAGMRASFPKPSDFDKEMEIDFGMHVGSPAYARYREVTHVATGLPYDDRRPLALALDFNTNPMSLIIGQVREIQKQLLVLREFVYGPTTIDSVINDFRNAYPAHRADIRIYGDATSGTNAQTAKSNWDIVRAAFRGYHIVPQFRVPLGNPRIGDRLNAVNRMLSGDGPYAILIERDLCPELIRDFREVILTKDGKKIYKVNDADDPYYFRTHPSDAFGYWIYREWPTILDASVTAGTKRQPLVSGPLLGELDYGPDHRARLRLARSSRAPMNRGRSR